MKSIGERRGVWGWPTFVAYAFALSVGCGGGAEATGSLSSNLPASEGTDTAPAAPAASAHTLSSRSLRDPALFLGPEPNAAAVGYIGDDARVVVTGAPQGGRVPVQVQGALVFEGWLDARALAAVVQRRGKVKGAPVYLAPGDRVRVLKVRDDGLSEIEVSPRSEVLARSGIVLGPYQGVFPTIGLGSEAPADAQPPRDGTWHAVAPGTSVQVYDAPNGHVIAVLSHLREPLRLAVLREGAWKGVRIGQGPFLVGFVNVETAPAAEGPGAGARPSAPSRGVPSRLGVDKARPLWRVQAGATLTHGQTQFATVASEGYAREMGRFDDGTVDVFVAVNEQLAVRGLISASLLTRAEPTMNATPTTQPEQPQPAESQNDAPKVSPALPPPSSPNLSPTGGVPSPPQ